MKAVRIELLMCLNIVLIFPKYIDEFVKEIFNSYTPIPRN